MEKIDNEIHKLRKELHEDRLEKREATYHWINEHGTEK